MNDQEICDRLVEALKAEPRTLGDLRRQYELETTAVERTIDHFPERFERLTLGTKPGVKLRPKLPEKDARKFSLLKAAPGGVSLGRWKVANKFSLEESRSFSERYHDAVTIALRRDKKTGKEREIIILKVFDQPEPAAEMPQTVPGAPEGSSRVLPIPADLEALKSSPAKLEDPNSLEGDLLADASKLTLHLMAGWRSDKWLAEAAGISMAR